MHAGFKFQPREHPLPLDIGNPFFQPADIGFRKRQNLKSPAMHRRIAPVHREQHGREQGRLLAARSELGYTTSPHLAMPDEPEAVDAAAQEAITRAANIRDEERRMKEHNATLDLPFAERVRRLAAAAAAGQLDPQDMRLLELRIRKLRRKIAQGER